MTKILPLATDAAPAELAEKRLRESPYFYLKYVTCHFHGGVLTLRGRVPYAQLKDFAERIVSGVPGVEDVLNAVEVIDPLQPTIGVRGLRSAG